uniref:Uncharacterized protein n=1 Tax=Plectus sambesii TaxID=2011161 RepID=A0A914XIK0_9BILA
MALSCLSVIVREDAMRGLQLTPTLIKNGYVRHLVDSIATDDEALVRLLQVGRQSLRSLYLFQAKLTLFMRLAMSEVGSRTLQVLRVVQKLIDMKLWSEPPSELFVASLIADNRQPSQSPADRYLTALDCALSLCLALCSNAFGMGSECVNQILFFVALHSEMLSQCLRVDATKSDRRSTTLSLAAALVAHCYPTHSSDQNLPSADSKIGRLFGQLRERCNVAELVEIKNRPKNDLNTSAFSDVGLFLKRNTPLRNMTLL